MADPDLDDFLPRWFVRLEKWLDILLSEEAEDDIENPSLSLRLQEAYKSHLQVIHEGSLKRKIRPLQNGVPFFTDSHNVSRRNSNTSNQSRGDALINDTKKDDRVTMETTKDGNDGNKEEEEDDEEERMFREMEQKENIDNILEKLEKPSCCAVCCGRLQRIIRNKCCKYTPRIYFKKPLTWYSATAQLDAGTLLRENYLGISAGIVVGFISFLFFSAAFAHAPHIATLAAAYVMMFAVFGIAFSAGIRCVLLVTLPYLVASRTRMLIMMVATTLTTTGPAINFMHNSGNFRNAIACVLGQVNANAELMAKITKAPLKIIGRKLGAFIDKINDRLQHARDVLRQLKEVIKITIKMLNMKSDWIRGMIEACGDEVAMKNQCLAFFNNLYFGCINSIQSVAFVCNVVRVFAEQACKSVAGLNDICKKHADRLQSEVVAVAPVTEDQLDEGANSIMRYVGNENISVEIDEEAMDLDFGSNFSSQAAVTSLIEEKIDALMSALNAFKVILSWIMVAVTLFTVLQMVIQASKYRKKWLKRPYFDNSHITPQFVAQERRALENGRPTALPLNYFEKKDYVTLSALKWSKTEKKSAAGSIIFLLVGMSTIVFIIFIDYAMYHVVLTAAPAFSKGFNEVKENLNEMTSEGMGFNPSEVTVPEIQGNSTMSEMGRSFTALANPLKDVAFSVDASICRPRASEPNHRTTVFIIAALVFTLISIILQVYILRFRHMILAWYYPDGANRRAAWLRTYIRNSRGLLARLFQKFQKRKIKTRAGPSGRMKFFDRFLFMHPVLTRYLALVGIRRVFCANCATPGNPKKLKLFQQNFTQCPQCGAYYCKLCQADLGGICMFCNISINIQAMDVDFETWSSDEEYDYFYVRYFSRRKNDEVCLPKDVLDVQDTIPPGGIPQRRFFFLRFRRAEAKPKRLARPSRLRRMSSLIRRRRLAKRAHKGVMTTLPFAYPLNVPPRRRKTARLKRRGSKKAREVVRFRPFVEEIPDHPSSPSSVSVEEEDEVHHEDTVAVRTKSVQTPLFTGPLVWDDDLVQAGSFQFFVPSNFTDEHISSVKPLGDSVGISPLDRLATWGFARQDTIGTLKGTISNLSEITSPVCPENDQPLTSCQQLVCAMINPAACTDFTQPAEISSVKGITGEDMRTFECTKRAQSGIDKELPSTRFENLSSTKNVTFSDKVETIEYLATDRLGKTAKPCSRGISDAPELAEYSFRRIESMPSETLLPPSSVEAMKPMDSTSQLSTIKNLSGNLAGPGDGINRRKIRFLQPETPSLTNESLEQPKALQADQDLTVGTMNPFESIFSESEKIERCESLPSPESKFNEAFAEIMVLKPPSYERTDNMTIVKAVSSKQPFCSDIAMTDLTSVKALKSANFSGFSSVEEQETGAIDDTKMDLNQISDEKALQEAELGMLVDKSFVSPRSNLGEPFDSLVLHSTQKSKTTTEPMISEASTLRDLGITTDESYLKMKSVGEEQEPSMQSYGKRKMFRILEMPETESVRPKDPPLQTESSLLLKSSMGTDDDYTLASYLSRKPEHVRKKVLEIMETEGLRLDDLRISGEDTLEKRKISFIPDLRYKGMASRPEASKIAKQGFLKSGGTGLGSSQKPDIFKDKNNLNFVPHSGSNAIETSSTRSMPPHSLKLSTKSLKWTSVLQSSTSQMKMNEKEIGEISVPATEEVELKPVGKSARIDLKMPEEAVSSAKQSGFASTLSSLSSHSKSVHSVSSSSEMSELTMTKVPNELSYSSSEMKVTFSQVSNLTSTVSRGGAKKSHGRSDCGRFGDDEVVSYLDASLAVPSEDGLNFSQSGLSQTMLRGDLELSQTGLSSLGDITSSEKRVDGEKAQKGRKKVRPRGK